MLTGMTNVKQMVLLFCAALILASTARGQAVEGHGPRAAVVQENKEVLNVDHYLDRILNHVSVAAGAAEVITEADPYRREAEQMLKTGRRDEARALLLRAGELVAAATPEGDEKRKDPMMREYLRQINARLAALDETVTDSPPVSDVGAVPAEVSAANPRVAAFLNYFRGRGRSRLEIGAQRLAQYRSMMARVLREEGVPEWLLAVGFVESTYNPAAHSPAQAHGIWQFIPGTGDQYGLRRTAWADERGDPEKSTRAAARYLRDLHAQFGDWLLALAGYNWGGGRVANVIRRTGIRDFWTMSSRGLMPAETSNYVPSILAAAQLLGLAEGGQGPNLTGRGASPSVTNPVTVPEQPAAEDSSELMYPPEEADKDAGDQEETPSAEGNLNEAAERYNVPASEIRLTQPGYYDIPQFRNGRRTGYVRVRIR